MSSVIEQSSNASTQEVPSISGANILYTNEFPILKTDTPLGHPHIVDASLVTDDRDLKLRFADGVATLLFKSNPAALEAFLNLNNENFTYWAIEPESGFRCHCITFRKGQQVTWGWLCHTPRAWDHRTVFNITESGMWQPVEHYDVGMVTQRDELRVERGGAVSALAVFLTKRWEDEEDQKEETRRGFSLDKATMDGLLQSIDHTRFEHDNGQ